MRAAEAHTLNRDDLDDFIQLAINNGLAWTWPGVDIIGKQMKRGKE
jgi:hypothetical protein